MLGNFYVLLNLKVHKKALELQSKSVTIKTFALVVNFKRNVCNNFITIFCSITIISLPFLFSFYFQFCSDWPRLWSSHSGNPSAVRTSPCESSNNRWSAQNETFVDFLFIPKTQNFLYVVNNFSGNDHAFLIYCSMDCLFSTN